MTRRGTTGSDVRGLVFDIKRYAIHDGPGIRTAVYLKGCPLHCAWCHNPEGIDAQVTRLWVREKCLPDCGFCVSACPQRCIERVDGGIRMDRGTCVRCGRCADVCPTEAMQCIGRWMDPWNLHHIVLRDRTFYEESGGGVTFSGGEPLHQEVFLETMLRRLSQSGIHTAIDTAGHASWDTFQRVLPWTRLVLFDIKSTNAEAMNDRVGVDGALILENFSKLMHEKTVDVSVRIPVIPGFNDDPDEMRLILDFVAQFQRRLSVYFLPYHAAARHKYRKLGLKNEMESLQEPLKEEMKTYCDMALVCGLDAHIGG